MKHRTQLVDIEYETWLKKKTNYLLNVIPHELIMCILTRLPLNDIVKFGMTCGKAAAITELHCLWKWLIIRDYPESLDYPRIPISDHNRLFRANMITYPKLFYVNHVVRLALKANRILLDKELESLSIMDFDLRLLMNNNETVHALAHRVEGLRKRERKNKKTIVRPTKKFEIHTLDRYIKDCAGAFMELESTYNTFVKPLQNKRIHLRYINNQWSYRKGISKDYRPECLKTVFCNPTSPKYVAINLD